MVSPNSDGKNTRMPLRTILLWSCAGILGITALMALRSPDTPSLTLERGLGPEVETSRL